MLELRNLAIQLQGEALFSPVNLIIDAGEVVTLMGPSGSGKSTILSAIAGDLDPAFLCAGDILLGSQSLHGVPMERRHIGLLYQDDLLFPHMNVGENLGFALPQGLTRSARQERINEHLVLAGLHNYARRDVASLSGGQRARVSVLRTLLAEPQ
ncbi:MAG: ATP-binding cassette domain-containing protein, partial [Natronospirillum sp.]